MSERFIKNLNDLSFEPFDNYGKPVEGMSWHTLRYDRSNAGFGTYILTLNACATILPHIHQGYEECYVIEGELQDADGKIFKKGDFVTFEPGTEHNSHTKNGCILIVFMRGINKTI